MPDDDVRDFDNTAFGRPCSFGMREILGYAPVEPDGSVRVKVPANVAFDDHRARRERPPHRLRAAHNWLQVSRARR